MIFILQLWWIGWGLHDYINWSFLHFLLLIFASICISGATEMALPDPDDEHFDMLVHSLGLGWVSAASLLVYFLLGLYINITMFDNPVNLSIIIPSIGVIFIPRWFKALSVVFRGYLLMVLYLTV